jgi:hypothetical protein
MLADRWTADPQTGLGSNEQGHFVSMMPASNQLVALHHALGWPTPRGSTGNSSRFPSNKLERELGRHDTRKLPRRRGADLGESLAWDDATGACAPPEMIFDDHLLAPEQQVELADEVDFGDWIDLLLLRAPKSATVGELLGALRDRLIGDPEGTAAESALLSELVDAFIVLPPDAADVLEIAGADVDHGALEEALREACGAWLSSPQFRMQGLTRGEPDVVSLEVCFDGEPCSRLEHCEAWASHFGADARCE